MITDVNCDLSLQSTCLLINLSTRQLRIMITDVNCNLSLQSTGLLVNLSTCKPVNTSTYQQSTTNYANDTNSLAIRIRAIREIRCSYHKVQSSMLKVQSK